MMDLTPEEKTHSVAILERTTDTHVRRAASRAAAWARGVLPFASRADLVESLDGDAIERVELGRNLADLARLGRLPGGTSASVAAIQRLAPKATDVSVLDVGAGRGDMALAFAGRGWRTVALDSHPEVLRIAHPMLGDRGVDLVDADARALPYGEGAFDVTHCSLLIHHLDPADAIAVLREMTRVARRGVVINDLRRGPLPFVATGVAVALLGTCRTTRADGLASVRRAYTLPELDDLLTEAGLEVVWRSTAFMPRVVTAAVRRTAR